MDEAAQDAHPRDEVEAEDMAEAERQGKSRAKEDDPSVNQAPKPGRGPDE